VTIKTNHVLSLGFVGFSVASTQKRQPTKRAPDAGESGAIPSIFLRLIIFHIGRRPAARPSAGNANRWAKFLYEG